MRYLERDYIRLVSFIHILESVIMLTDSNPAPAQDVKIKNFEGRLGVYSVCRVGFISGNKTSIILSKLEILRGEGTIASSSKRAHGPIIKESL